MVAHKPWVRALAAGLLLSLPFWQTAYGWLVVPCVMGYLAWLSTRPTVRQVWLSGISFFAVVVNWMYHIHATELIANNFLAIAFLVLTFSIVVGSLSLGFLLLGIGIKRLEIKIYEPRSLVLLPALWALCEWARSFIFSIVSLGPGGSIGPHWNFGSLAFAASVTPLGYGARIVGQYGLSALVVLMSLGLLLFLRKSWKWGSLAVGTVLVICAAGWLVSPSAHGPQLRIGVVQLDDGNYSDYGYQRDLGRITAAHKASNPLDLLVMPEYSYLFTNQEYHKAELAATTKLFADNPQGLIITSRSGQSSQGHKNLVTFYKPNSDIAHEQEKQFLIPAGEYIPYFYEWILVLSGNTKIIGDHQAKNEVTPSNQLARPVDYGSSRVGSLACSGAIAPDFYRKLADQGATVLTNSAALSTMGLASSYYAQARQMSAFIAVANARPFVQSARGAQVFALDSSGGAVAESDQPGVHYIETELTTNNQRTPYSYLGDSIILAILLAAGGVVLFMSKR